MRRILLPCAILIATLTLRAQQPAHADREMLVPLLTEAEMQDLDAGQGALVFNTTARAFYFRDVSGWRPLLGVEHTNTGAIEWHEQYVGAVPHGQPKISTGSTGFWDLTGNAGTSTQNFLGTTDNVDLRLRVNNVHAGRIQSVSGGPQLTGEHTSYGIGAGGGDLGFRNSFFGFHAGSTWTGPGNDNVMLGSSSGSGMTEGDENIFIGGNAALHAGSGNTVVGMNAGGSGASLHTDVTLLGRSASTANGLTNATALGSKASVTSNNALVLGSINGVNGATADVNVGIGTTAPQRALHVSRGASGGTSNANAVLVVEDNTNAYINLMTPSANESGILFGTSLNNAAGAVMYNQSSTPDGLAFRTNGNVTRAVIDAGGLMGIGVLAPATHMDINGGLTLRRPATVSAPVGTSTVTVGDNSYIRISSTGAATVNLSNGLATGQVLMIEGAGGTITVNDNAAVSNCNLVANRSLGTNDVLLLIFNGTDWVETGFTNN